MLLSFTRYSKYKLFWKNKSKAEGWGWAVAKEFLNFWPKSEAEAYKKNAYTAQGMYLPKIPRVNLRNFMLLVDGMNAMVKQAMPASKVLQPVLCKSLGLNTLLPVNFRPFNFRPL